MEYFHQTLISPNETQHTSFSEAGTFLAVETSKNGNLQKKGNTVEENGSQF